MGKDLGYLMSAIRKLNRRKRRSVGGHYLIEDTLRSQEKQSLFIFVSIIITCIIVVGGLCLVHYIG